MFFKKFIFTFIFLISFLSAKAAKITIHYKRFNNDYNNWNIWTWENGKEGKNIEFNSEDAFGKVATFSAESKVGFIVKKGNWLEKDVSKDRFFTPNGKNMDVFLVQGDENIYYSKNNVDPIPSLEKCFALNQNEISISLFSPISIKNNKDFSGFELTDSKGNIYPLKSIKSKSLEEIKEAILITNKNLPLTETFFLKLPKHKKTIVSTEKLFSSKEFENKYTYLKDDLGVTLKKNSTFFKVWAPFADKVILNIFDTSEGGIPTKYQLKKSEKGVWKVNINKNLENKFYTYSIVTNGESVEAVDLYAKAVGINGNRGAIIDLSKTNPIGWEKIEKPILKSPTDAIIYEIHIRDFSKDISSGIKNKGTFAGMMEENSKNNAGLSTGIDHLKELGVTHVQILPSFDYASIDEKVVGNTNFNWGYDPLNYNVPEGSYSSNPYDPKIRVLEFKTMVQNFHKNGIRVIMDVVFNHTAKTFDSNFNKFAPNYFYRKNGENFSNASGCGNETASERIMVRKYIVDSVKYWAKEYKVDGFRFDLMGIHDIETMNKIKKELVKIDPNILIYGEPWTASDSPLPENLRAVKISTSKLNGIGVFNDDIRDGIKGHVFDAKAKGFASGLENQEERVKFGIVGATFHPQVNYMKAWAKKPMQSINYISAHDNLTLWDKFASSNSEDSIETRKDINKLSASIVFLSQGIPFFQGGEEFLRSKALPNGGFDENSYKSSDSINSIKWDLKTKNIDIFNYYKGLIAFRKEHTAFRYNDNEDIVKNISFFTNLPKNVIAYEIKDEKENIIVIHNARRNIFSFTLPKGKWGVYINKNNAGTKLLTTVENKVDILPISTLVLTKKR